MESIRLSLNSQNPQHMHTVADINNERILFIMKNLFLILPLLAILTFSTPNIAKSQCPNGRINGANCCGRHTDQNNNGICDWSEVKDKRDTSTIEKGKESSGDKKTGPRKAGKENGLCKGCPHERCLHSEVATVESIAEASEPPIPKSKKTEMDTTTVAPAKKETTTHEQPYDLILISLICFGLYGFTWGLVKLEKAKLSTHRKIWNIGLLITFLISCLFGFFLVIQINYNFVISGYRTVLYWHVQVGIAMTIIALFHSLWHLSYYRNLFRKPIIR